MSPFKNELKAADIAGYVQTVRSEAQLDDFTKRLWDLRNIFRTRRFPYGDLH